MKEKEGTLMRLQGAIFDMDGTLLDSMPTWKTLWYELLRELGADPSRDIEREITTLNMADSAAYCVQKFHLQQTPGELAEAITHLAFYQGWPSAMAATLLLKDVLVKRA